MSRLRTSLSESPLDQEIQRSVASAERLIKSSLELCLRQQKNSDYEKSKVARVRRDLEKALDALQHVRRIELAEVAKPSPALPEVKKPLLAPPLATPGEDGGVI